MIKSDAYWLVLNMKILINRPVRYESRASRGFTLLELMVAISIFAVVSLLATGGMSSVLNIQKQSQDKLEELNHMQMFFEMFATEIKHFVIRPVRGEYGLELNAMSSETSDGLEGIEFTHQGRMIPGQTYTLQRVAYYVEDQKLYKKIWPVLDRAEDTRSRHQLILSHVKSFNMAYLIETQSMQFEWRESLDKTNIPLLRGIKLTINNNDNDIYRIFPVRI